jgi:hypothetical protein
MGTIQTAKNVAEFREPERRGIDGCHNCTRVRMMPSYFGRRQSECSKLGCYVPMLAICKYHQVKATSGASS